MKVELVTPPFRGIVETTLDALVIFQAAKQGLIPRVTRRLSEKERGMIQSGAVFVFDEGESGMKRWTDGLVWSPSRILSNFLVYREVEKRTEKGMAALTSYSANTVDAQGNQILSSRIDDPNDFSPNEVSPDDSRPSTAGADTHQLGRHDGPSGMTRSLEQARERQLVGSLTASVRFKEGGLVKRTMSASINGVAQHLVSYYTLEDAMNGRLRTPSSLPELASLEINPEYLRDTFFRDPPKIEEDASGVLRYWGEPEKQPLSPPLRHTPLPAALPMVSSSSPFITGSRSKQDQRSRAKSKTRTMTIRALPPNQLTTQKQSQNQYHTISPATPTEPFYPAGAEAPFIISPSPYFPSYQAPYDKSPQSHPHPHPHPHPIPNGYPSGEPPGSADSTSGSFPMVDTGFPTSSTSAVRPLPIQQSDVHQTYSVAGSAGGSAPPVPPGGEIRRYSHAHGVPGSDYGSWGSSSRASRNYHPYGNPAPTATSDSFPISGTSLDSYRPGSRARYMATHLQPGSYVSPETNTNTNTNSDSIPIPMSASAAAFTNPSYPHPAPPTALSAPALPAPAPAPTSAPAPGSAQASASLTLASSSSDGYPNNRPSSSRRPYQDQPPYDSESLIVSPRIQAGGARQTYAIPPSEGRSSYASGLLSSSASASLPPPPPPQPQPFYPFHPHPHQANSTYDQRAFEPSTQPSHNIRQPMDNHSNRPFTSYHSSSTNSYYPPPPSSAPQGSSGTGFHQPISGPSTSAGSDGFQGHPLGRPSTGEPTSSRLTNASFRRDHHVYPGGPPSFDLAKANGAGWADSSFHPSPRQQQQQQQPAGGGGGGGQEPDQFTQVIWGYEGEHTNHDQGEYAYGAV
ncbi:Gluconate transport-inducing protein [Phaffia rhodozyma]|uniref:Gluconate transport-inducing protein n=1 Tax=Phaffia rhodozyma TaxID=264483 RepID=A0A0F7SLQ2_PHARH|nr:Gluconate transport-inducing protein [Phaffia rhodozyma]